MKTQTLRMWKDLKGSFTLKQVKTNLDIFFDVCPASYVECKTQIAKKINIFLVIYS